MSRERDRELRRRRQRRQKIHKLKVRLAQSKDLREKQRLIDKIQRISVYPNQSIPRE
jgi:hypothetical protein